MDSLITAAAHALAAGNPLAALDRVALRNDPPALALRGIAMAQLGELGRAKDLLHRAARAFGTKEGVARARCIVAEAEIALAARDLDWPAKTLEAARATLAAQGDRLNAAHASYVEVRRLLLIGRLDEAERILNSLRPKQYSAALRAAHDLLAAGIAIRRIRTKTARTALMRAERAARLAAIPALSAEIKAASSILQTPAARLIVERQARPLILSEIESLLKSKMLIVDACRYQVHQGHRMIPLNTRPVLFALARALAEYWPGDASRDALIVQAFGGKEADESHRARLRVEIGRLRTLLKSVVDITATPGGFRLKPRPKSKVAVLARPVEEEHAALLAFLTDGEAWSSSALALALGTSQRTVQRTLDALAINGKVQSFGHGRARRWVTPPLPGITTTLLLPAHLPID